LLLFASIVFEKDEKYSFSIYAYITIETAFYKGNK